MPVAAIWRCSSSSSSVETSPEQTGSVVQAIGIPPVGQSFAGEMLAFVSVSNWYASSLSQRGRCAAREGSRCKGGVSACAWLRNQSTGNDVAEDESAAGGDVPVSAFERAGCEQGGNDVLRAAVG